VSAAGVGGGVGGGRGEVARQGGGRGEGAAEGGDEGRGAESGGGGGGADGAGGGQRAGQTWNTRRDRLRPSMFTTDDVMGSEPSGGLDDLGET